MVHSVKCAASMPVGDADSGCLTDQTCDARSHHSDHHNQRYRAGDLVNRDDAGNDGGKCACVNRHDPDRRGKGYALACGLRYLQKRGQSPISDPEVLVVIDADCRVSVGTIERLARAAAATGRPVQALYEMHARPAGGLREFAWLVKNHVRPLGYMRLGLPCQLMGAVAPHASSR